MGNWFKNSKIVLDEEVKEETSCPLYNLGLCKKCKCIGGYYDSRTFDFEKCPYCTTASKYKNRLEVGDENIY